ncbi:hypothetical protein GBA65_09900 [Rubrobacter marinus]|uniref:Lipoprotein n=1 Tax=Rubrobacter marinus TaxID=2653852 RepID=A0A6G8PX35_9ACTN|nr:nuclease A inhibitor family protein [Rubrobacter marinus]QIN78781.1 hypothetical protein GBA65_09900 [Rubrobacter marinus]
MRKIALLAVATLLACALPTEGATAQEDGTGERLLEAAEGLQMPSSEADSAWYLVSYAGVDELPDAESFGVMSGCPRAGTTRQDFDETLARLSEVEPWMDEGQVRSARGFRKLGKTFRHALGEDLAVYRCEDGGPEVGIYFVGAADGRLTGLKTISIET